MNYRINGYNHAIITYKKKAPTRLKRNNNNNRRSMQLEKEGNHISVRYIWIHLNVFDASRNSPVI